MASNFLAEEFFGATHLRRHSSRKLTLSRQRPPRRIEPDTAKHSCSKVVPISWLQSAAGYAIQNTTATASALPVRANRAPRPAPKSHAPTPTACDPPKWPQRTERTKPRSSCLRPNSPPPINKDPPRPKWTERTKPPSSCSALIRRPQKVKAGDTHPSGQSSPSPRPGPDDVRGECSSVARAHAVLC